MGQMGPDEREHLAQFAELRVVTAANWLARDFASARLLPVSADLGLDIPGDTTRTAWWCSGQHAARLAASGVQAAFTGPSAHWQAAFPRSLTRRSLTALTLGALRERPAVRGRALFIKIADVKIAHVPAAWWPRAESFIDVCEAFDVPASTPLLMTGTRMDFVEEHRMFVTRGLVTAASIYRSGDRTWDYWHDGDQPSSQEAARFAQDALDALSNQPRGWVLDVGLTRQGHYAIVEANPAWSCNPYHCDPAGAVRSIVAAQSVRASEPEWPWEPGDYLASRARPLAVTRAGLRA